LARPLTPILSPDAVEGVVGVPTIAFEDVHFAYPGGRQAAHDGLTFTVAAGEKIGIVGPSGSGKSSIARLLLRLFDPQSGPILILDEALSSVDAENEAVIQQAIDRLSQGRTTLILAHRLSSVIGADRILVLDSGHIVESGRHAELIRRDGPYRRLMGAQAQERGEDDVSLDLAEPIAAAGQDRETS